MGLGLVHFGFVVTYLSEPLVRGYTTAASVQVFVSQLKYVFGLHLSSFSGPLSLIYVSEGGRRDGGGLCPVTSPAGRDPASPQTVLEVCQKLPQAVAGTVVTAVVAGVVLVLVKLLNGKLQRRLPLPIPGELLTVRSLGGRGEGQVRLCPGGHW